MNCTICGKSTLPGAMLCAPCKAALKRARYVTVQEDMRRPSVIDVRVQARRRRTASATPVSSTPPAVEAQPPVAATASAPTKAQLVRQVAIGFLVLAVATASAIYFGQRELAARSQDDSAVGQAPVNPPAVSEGTLATKPAVASVPDPVPSPVPSAAPLPAGPADASRPPVDAVPNPSATKLAAGNAGKRATMKNTASFSTTNGDPPDAVPMPEPEKPRPAPPPPPPPAPDRWQSMREAIAQCDRLGVFDGIICGQKARIQYCEGYWGKVQQCPGPTVNPDR
jgi:hypothetical protein